MEEILQHVSDENKEWVQSLTLCDIANLLDKIALIPHMKSINKQPEKLPVTAGKIGESEFAYIISHNMPSDYTLIDTAKQGHKGDFILQWQSYKTNQIYKILVDVKNYKTTVPQKEIDKFYWDIKLNSSINGGLLISLNSKIVGISKLIDFKKLQTDNNTVPVCFINSSTPEVICEIVKLIFHSIELQNINENFVLVDDALISGISSLSDQVQLITECRDAMQKTKTTIEIELNDMMFKLMKCEHNISSELKNINKMLINKVKPIQIDDNETNSDKNHEVCNNREVKTSTKPNKPIPVDKLTDYLIDTYSSSIDPGYDAFIRSICKLTWYHTYVDLPKRKWVLERNKSDAAKETIFVKFAKKSMTIVFSQTFNSYDKFVKTITDDEDLTNISKCKLKKDGNNILLCPLNFPLILELCKVLMDMPI